MIDVKKLKERVQRWHDTVHQQLCNMGGEDAAQQRAYHNVLCFIEDLEKDCEAQDKKDYLCTCHTIRCDECIIRDG